jgi:putative PIN family toxin of toxin-antitoxin system
VGTKAKKRLRVILDTNVLVSALLFRGELSSLVMLWKKGVFIPVFSRETFAELRSVLAYPKFKLGSDEIDSVLHS